MDRTLFAYRCFSGAKFMDTVAETPRDALILTGMDEAVLVGEHPMLTLKEIREQWPVNRQSLAGIRKVEQWMVAAVRVWMINDQKFNEIDLAVQEAKRKLGEHAPRDDRARQML